MFEKIKAWIKRKRETAREQQAADRLIKHIEQALGFELSCVQLLCNFRIVHTLHEIHFKSLVLYASACCLSAALYLFYRFVYMRCHYQCLKACASDEERVK